jgi:hypothetical protein
MMRSSSSGRVCGAAQLFALATCAVACGDVEDTQFRADTLELAAGDYYGLTWGGTQDERFFVVARKGASDGDAVVLSPPDRTPCSLGGVARYNGPLQPRTSGRSALGSPSPARIQVFDSIDSDGFGTLQFAGTDCDRSAFTLPGASYRYIWPLYSPDLLTLKLAALTRDRNVYLIDPWAEEAEMVAPNVTLVWPVDDGVWLVENGVLVKHRLDGNQVLRTGSGVSEMLPLGGADDVAYVDNNGLAVVRANTVKRLISDACGLHGVDEFRPGSLAFYSPCADNALVVRSPDGKLTRYRDGVTDVRTQPGRLFFTTDSDSGTTLWVATSAHPETADVLIEQQHFAIQDLSLTKSEHQLAVLAALDDNTYSLWHIDLDSDAHELTTVLSGITVRRTSGPNMATLDVDRVLTLTDVDGIEVLFRVANSAPNYRFVFGQKHSALAYLSHFDPDSKLGTLEVHFLKGPHLVLAQHVREFSEVWWPERGIVYTVGGDKPALRFARIDVPCETSVSDYTTWSCGF